MAVRPTWLGAFAQLLVQDVTRKDLGGIFQNIAVISFNYDRSIRRFLPLALMSQFGLEQHEAQEIGLQLPIYHPYGSLGPLPWQAAGHGVEYGADRVSLIEVARELRTFTEQIDSERLVPMRQALEAAERLVFLGFGYHRQNLALLGDGLKPKAQRVYGTSMGLSDADEEIVRRETGRFIVEHFRAHVDPQLSSVGCAQFLIEHFRALTA